jgi:hypothetical protein
MTQDQAKTILSEIANQLKSFSYADLQKLDASEDDEWRLFREVVIGSEKLTIFALISEWGLRRRISVELIALSEDGAIGPENIGCVYFERFRSGKLRG